LSNVFYPNSSKQRKVIRGGAARGLSRLFWWFAQIKSNYLELYHPRPDYVKLKKICANQQKRLDKSSIWHYNRRRQHFASIFDFALWRRDLLNLKYFDQTCKKDLTNLRFGGIIGAGSSLPRFSTLHFGAETCPI